MPNDHGSTLFFIGAGASTEFGIPNVKVLASKVRKSLPRYARRIKCVQDKLASAGLPSNIEGVLAYLEASGSPSEFTRIWGSRLIALYRRKSTVRPNTSDRTLAMLIRKEIRKFCYVSDSSQINKIVRIYEDFVKRSASKLSLPLKIPVENPLYPELDIFTTNYDNTIEEFCGKVGILPITGYKEVAHDNYIFDENEFEQPNVFRLYKLNGSVLFARTKEDRIVRSVGVTFEAHGELVDIENDIIIYPGASQRTWIDPHLQLLYRLRRLLSGADNCIIIGYSFNDVPIRDIFHCAMKENPSLNLHLVDINANNIKKSIFLDCPQVYPIPKRFKNFDPTRDLH